VGERPAAWDFRAEGKVNSGLRGPESQARSPGQAVGGLGAQKEETGNISESSARSGGTGPARGVEGGERPSSTPRSSSGGTATRKARFDAELDVPPPPSWTGGRWADDESRERDLPPALAKRPQRGQHDHQFVLIK